jgi:hypothetical protein
VGLAFLDFQLAKGWAIGHQPFAVGNRTRQQGESRAHGFFLRRVDVVLVAHVGDDGEPDGRQDLGGHDLGLPQFRPGALADLRRDLLRQALSIPVPGRQLDREKRKITLLPIDPPVPDHVREQRPILPGTVGVGLALVP